MQRSVLIRGFLFLSLLISFQVAAADEPPNAIFSDLIWFRGEDFTEGDADNAVAGPPGLSMVENVVSASYTSPEFEAPIPFNALVPQWQATLPPNDAPEHPLEFEFRTAKGDEWSEWIPIHASHDNMLPGDTMVTGDMLVVPAEDMTHRKVQFRVFLMRLPGGTGPRLEALRIDFIDSTAGPTTEELIAQVQALPAPEQEEGTFPKPAVIPRGDPDIPNDGWCFDPACEYTDGLDYHPVSHLILHHTVTSSTGDSAATVRAIWQYHTFTRGWGDIGYNYLIDVNGVIFEGHLGGDDVVGTHAAGANSGSMAASLIGNFVSITPPDVMMNAAANLFAWKADQKGIDIYDSGSLPFVDWGLPKLMGHRDVYGTTQCPGDKAHALLPTLREMIAERIDFTPPHLYFDELNPDSNFSRNSATWLDGPSACGIDSHAYYAWSTTDPDDPDVSHNSATWKPQVDVPGEYELSVYAPYCRTGEPDTNGAVYTVTDVNGASTVVVNQEAHLGHWVPIGSYWFNGTSTSIKLTNLTSTDNDSGVWFDAVRLRYLAPGAINLEPSADSWAQSRTVEFEWTVSNGAPVTEQRLQLSEGPFFNNPFLNDLLGPNARSYTHTFADDQDLVYWRVVLTTSDGQIVHSPYTSFGVDTLPPTSSAIAVLRFPDGRLMPLWRGEDANSGVVGYNVDYRAEGSATWVDWLTNTSATMATFMPPQVGTTYWFRSQALDTAGNVEAEHVGDGDINTAQALLMDEAAWFPVIHR